MTIAAATGASSPGVLRRINAGEVLRHAWDADVVTASDLIRRTGLTRSTVIGVCDDLIARGWLTTTDDARSTGAYRTGRPARRYTLVADAAHVVGVDAGQHHATAVVADLRGRVVGRATGELDPDPGGPHAGATRRAAVARLVAAAREEAGVAASEVLVITVGVPAPTDLEGASPEGVGGFWPTMNPGYATHLARPGTHVIVENDANLAAVAERAFGQGQDVLSTVTLLAGERFGAGFVLDGRLVRGRRGAAGEMGLLDLVAGVGSAHGIGLLLREWARAGRDDGTIDARSTLAAVPLDQLGAPEVLAAADDGDPCALALVDRLAARLARICVVLEGMLDVDRIIIAGAVAPAAGLLIHRTIPLLAEIAHGPAPEVVASELGDGAVTLGAVTRALDHVRACAFELDLPGHRRGEAGRAGS
ncbi:ROK family transcriptional regulator [Clavibacter tessellarius]|uniref:Uncharacterized protein n=1 Tax=Clavibacter tessellarius TaxID=31965 RepID=A0A154V257_9MICO|nr:ROK family transcriptional regulator [Clavibacter michiganensis]KZC95448.1 hypothetical protein AWH51_08055 [Clavibacter michiganensis subsp. tessellarius]